MHTSTSHTKHICKHAHKHITHKNIFKKDNKQITKQPENKTKEKVPRAISNFRIHTKPRSPWILIGFCLEEPKELNQAPAEWRRCFPSDGPTHIHTQLFHITHFKAPPPDCLSHVIFVGSSLQPSAASEEGAGTCLLRGNLALCLHQ